MSNDLLRGRQVAESLTNKSGGGVVAGDVVILDPANANAFTTTTTSGYIATAVGVALETIANNAVGRICFSGYVPVINLNTSATLGYFLKTHTVAKQATPISTYASGTFGEVQATGTTPPALLFGGLPGQAGASLTVEEVDGSPTDAAISKIVFPNGTLGIASHVATYTPTAGAAFLGARYKTPTSALPTYTANTFTTVNYSVSDYDTDSAVTTGASWVFTVPTSQGGKYRVHAQIRMAANVATYMQILVNGAMAVGAGPRSNSSGESAGIGEIDAVLTLAAGDTVAAQIYPAISNSAASANNPYSYIEIYKVG